MSQFWSDAVGRLQPYVPGEQPPGTDLIKLNTNEHPLAPSPRALAALAAVPGEALRRYPDPSAAALRAQIAAAEGLDPAAVFVGNGSDEVLAHTFVALLDKPHPLVFADITYGFYAVWARRFGIEVEMLPLAPDFNQDLDAMIATKGPLLIANPNAPTGLALSRADIAALLAARPERLVVVDEAYNGFGAESAAPLLHSHDNLLVTRSLSKTHALAGLRLGYALGSATLVEGLERVKNAFNSYPVDAVAQRVAAAALADTDWFENACLTVVANRGRLGDGLEALGFQVMPSRANFLFARHPAYPGAGLFAGLRERGIVTRRWDTPRIADYLRITVGTEAQVDAVLAALAQMMD